MVFINFILSGSKDIIAKYSTVPLVLVGKFNINILFHSPLLILWSVWYWNCYPGARVDSHAPLYEYSFGGLYKDWNWTERFPGRKEILQYFHYVDKRLGLSKDVELNTAVDSAEFDTKSSLWKVALSTGEVVEAKYLVLATGFASKRYTPAFKGMEKYEGIMHHTCIFITSSKDCHC